MKIHSVAILIAISYCSAAFFSPDAIAVARGKTHSGLPVPRFVSMKFHETRCRIGPTREHPVRYTFKKKGAPVLVIAETRDHWRKVRDRDGSECWAHASVLSAPNHVYAMRLVEMRKKPSDTAPIRAEIEAGALVRFDKVRDGWIRVAAGSHRGWAPADAFWGAGASRSVP